MKARVLMVDDEEDLVWTTVRQMAREKPDWTFEGLSDPELALDHLRQAPPDVLITDVRMPKMSGIELLLAARSARPNLPVVVITAYGNAEVRKEVESRRSVEYLEKPFSFPSLVEAVERSLTRDSGFSGAISLPMLPDLIQIYALSRTTGALRIARGAQEGAIWFAQGEIVHAACDSTVGEEAFYQLLTWDGGRFALESDGGAPARTIDATWQELLVEGCRRMDEAERDRTAVAAVSAEAAPAAPEAVFPDALWEALGPQVGESAPQAFVLALKPAKSTGVALQGTVADPGSWAEAVAGLIALTERLCGTATRGAVECVAADVALVAAWDREADTALVFADAVPGRSGPSRFRSNASRWRETCRPWLRSE
jgi:CheY-like chemotaxis protein